MHGITREEICFRNLPISFYTRIVSHLLRRQLALIKNKNCYLQTLNASFDGFLSELDFSRCKIFRIGNGIDFTEYKILNNDKFVIIWIGRMEKNTKGADLLLSIIYEVNKLFGLFLKNESPEFTIIGSGNYSEYFSKRSKKYINVKYHGYVSDEEKKRLLASSNMMLLTSRIEPYPIAAIEGIASGLYILSTITSGPSEIVNKDPLFGETVKFQPRKFARRIYELFLKWQKDKEHFYIDKITRRQYGSIIFSQNKMAEMYDEMIQSIINFT